MFRGGKELREHVNLPTSRNSLVCEAISRVTFVAGLLLPIPNVLTIRNEKILHWRVKRLNTVIKSIAEFKIVKLVILGCKLDFHLFSPI